MALVARRAATRHCMCPGSVPGKVHHGMSRALGLLPIFPLQACKCSSCHTDVSPVHAVQAIVHDLLGTKKNQPLQSLPSVLQPWVLKTSQHFYPWRKHYQPRGAAQCWPSQPRVPSGNTWVTNTSSQSASWENISPGTAVPSIPDLMPRRGGGNTSGRSEGQEGRKT